MRLIRLFLILLLSVSLPFANVAAAAMEHCAQQETVAQSPASENMDHSGMHAGHHAMQDQTASDHHPHDSSSHDSAGCSSCSYCQSCASAVVPPHRSESVRVEPKAIVKTPVTDPVPRTFLEQPFRPPALAFA